MGVDYDAAFDIGFEIVSFPDREKDQSNYDFLEDFLQNTKYTFIVWGDGAYGGEYYYAVVLDKPLVPYNSSDEIFLKFKKELIELHDFLINNGFEIDDHWISGGLHVW